MLLPSNQQDTDKPHPGIRVVIDRSGKTIGIDSVIGYRPGDIHTVIDNNGQERLIRFEKNTRWEDITI